MKKQSLWIRAFLPLVVLFLAVLWSASLIQAEGQASPLDGMTFVGEYGKQGQQAEAKDEFSFKNGAFRSSACDPYGFGDGAYSANVKGETTIFQAETVSKNEGKIKWSGAVKGDSLDGIFMWYQEGKAPAEYWIKGKLRTEIGKS